MGNVKKWKEFIAEKHASGEIYLYFWYSSDCFTLVDLL
jgi:hypothetical protein